MGALRTCWEVRPRKRSDTACARTQTPPLTPLTFRRWDGEQSPTGSSGWLEMAVARPDWVLMDLARAITPSVLTDALNMTNHIADMGPAGTVRVDRGV